MFLKSWPSTHVRTHPDNVWEWFLVGCIERMHQVGFRWPICKSMILFTLRGCHTLDDLGVVAPWKLVEVVHCSREDIMRVPSSPHGRCEGDTSKVWRTPSGLAGSSARYWLWVLHVGECDLWVTTSKRIYDNLGIALMGSKWLENHRTSRKNPCVNICLPISLQACLYLFTHVLVLNVALVTSLLV